MLDPRQMSTHCSQASRAAQVLLGGGAVVTVSVVRHRTIDIRRCTRASSRSRRTRGRRRQQRVRSPENHRRSHAPSIANHRRPAAARLPARASPGELDGQQTRAPGSSHTPTSTAQPERARRPQAFRVFLGRMRMSRPCQPQDRAILSAVPTAASGSRMPSTSAQPPGRNATLPFSATFASAPLVKAHPPAPAPAAITPHAP